MCHGERSANTGITASFAAMLLVAMTAGVPRCPPEMGILGGLALPVQSGLAYENFALNVLDVSLADRSTLLNAGHKGRYGLTPGGQVRIIVRYGDSRVLGLRC